MNTNNFIKKEIIKTTLPEKYAVSNIVYQYRLILGEKNHPISLRKLADALNNILNPIGGNISHQSIKNWEDRKHLPNNYWMNQLLINAEASWCKDFAQDILAVLEPENYAPISVIAKNILEDSVSQVVILTHQMPYIPAYAS